MGKEYIRINKNYRKMTVEQSFKLAEELLLTRVCDDYIKQEVNKFTNVRMNDLKPILNINIENMHSINTRRYGIDGFTNFLVVKFYQRLLTFTKESKDLAEDKVYLLQNEIFNLLNDFKKVVVG